jgi:phospholipase C
VKSRGAIRSAFLSLPRLTAETDVLRHGWYDHAYSGVHNPSNTSGVTTPPGPQDFLTGTGLCGSPTATPLAGRNGRCGYGPRLPLLVLSPWAKHDYVDHTVTDQSSILRFIENNWRLPRIDGSFDAAAGTLTHLFTFEDSRPRNRTLYLDPVTGRRLDG